MKRFARPEGRSIVPCRRRRVPQVGKWRPAGGKVVSRGRDGALPRAVRRCPSGGKQKRRGTGLLSSLLSSEVRTCNRSMSPGRHRAFGREEAFGYRPAFGRARGATSCHSLIFPLVFGHFSIICITCSHFLSLPGGPMGWGLWPFLVIEVTDFFEEMTGARVCARRPSPAPQPLSPLSPKGEEGLASLEGLRRAMVPFS